MASNGKRRGRPPTPVFAPDGSVISGLSYHSSKHYYYPVGHQDVRLGTDFLQAWSAFKRWQASQEKSKAVVMAGDIDVELEYRERIEGGGVLHHDARVEIPEDLFLAQLRDWLSDPVKARRAAEATGWPLDRLESLPVPEPSPKLEALGKLYLEKSGVSKEWAYKSGKFWDQFVKLSGVSTVRELRQKQITSYYDAILAKGNSPTYAKQRFGLIKRVFNFAATRGVGVNEIEQVLKYCKIMVAPPAKGTDPHPIDRADFHKLHEAANLRWKSLLLAALNFCMYASEVAVLQWNECDLSKGTLVTNRNKTGVVRVAIIWGRTMTSLKRLQRFYERKGIASPYLFLSAYGRPFDPEGLRTAFKKLRKRAHVSTDVKFSDIRDGAYTAAVEHAPVVAGKIIATNAMLLAGHSSGISDHYVKRNPRMVQDACEAVEKAYFQ